MNRWKLFSLSLALMMGLVALAPIPMLAWDSGDSGYQYIDKILDDSDEREGASDIKADSSMQANNYDGVEEKDLEFIPDKEKSLGRAVVDPPEDTTE
jgi:hypothetical protein